MDENMEYICNNCNKKLLSKYTLKYHEEKCIKKIKNQDDKNKKYVCDKCNKNLSSKYNLNYHITNGCKLPDDEIIDLSCNYCKKTYKNKYSLKYHMEKYCKIKKFQDNSINNVDELKNEICEYKNEIDELKKLIYEIHTNQNVNKYTNLSNNNQSNNSILNNNINSNNGNNTININLVEFGKEDVGKLSDKDRARICTSGPNYLVDCVKLIHCNEKLPEYRNLGITNLRGNTGRVFKDNKWKEEKIDDLLNNIIKNSKEKCKEMYNMPFPENTKQRSLEFTKDYIEGREKLSNPMGKRDEIKLALYNASKDIKLLNN